MKLPRNLLGADLAQALSRLGYQITRQRGSHVRLTTARNGEHHVSVPTHDPLKVGTLAGILNDVAAHFELERDTLLAELFT